MRLDTTTTGCATLERINGNRVITQANTVLERFDLHGELTVKAPGVIIRQGIARGGAANNGNAVADARAARRNSEATWRNQVAWMDGSHNVNHDQIRRPPDE